MIYRKRNAHSERFQLGFIPAIRDPGVSSPHIHLSLRPSIGTGIGVVLLMLAGGCATKYRDMGSSGSGYFDYRITDDVFAVSFRGNASTYEEHVDLYLLRRSAELSLEHGFAFFRLMTEKGRNRKGSLGYSSFELPLVSPGTSIQIKCFKERPTGDGLVIDAKQFLRFNFPDEYPPNS